MPDHFSYNFCQVVEKRLYVYEAADGLFVALLAGEECVLCTQTRALTKAAVPKPLHRGGGPSDGPKRR